MLAVLEQSSGKAPLSGHLKRFGRALMDAPELAARLLDEISGIGTVSPREEHMSQLLSAALDEARMARENGQRRGAVLIDALEGQLGQLVRAEDLSFKGRLALSGAWVWAGLAPPASLAEPDSSIETLSQMEMDGPEEIGAIFDSLFGSLIGAGEKTASAVHALLAEMLPTVPADARHAVVRIAVSRPGEFYSELGCAWLLDGTKEVRQAAADGLFDRLAEERLSSATLARLAIMRSWLTDDAVKSRVDDLLRAAMRAGIATSDQRSERKIHRIVASMIDGSGAQSVAAAVQSGGARRVAVVLLKQGFGVKDAYVVPCASAAEQRDIMAMITDEVETHDVSSDYMAQVIRLALSEGLERGVAPVPGLVDVAQACGLTELRPRAAATGAILALADPEERTIGLSVQARGRLITASRSWADRYGILSSWFEDSDTAVEALETAVSQAAFKRAMWDVLEARRDHWAMVIARNGLLLDAAGEDGADEFVAVAAALVAGRDLKKTPAMQFVFDLSVHVWFERQSAPGGAFGEMDPEPVLGDMPPVSPAVNTMPAIPPEKTGELAKLFAPAGLTEPWLDGYLTGVCTAPQFVPPSEWLGPLFHFAGESLKTNRKLQRLVELSMLRYTATLSKFTELDDAQLIPQECPLLPIWADGYLTAWETSRPSWPSQASGRQGKIIRKLLEEATEGRIDRSGFAGALPAWLRQRFAEQKP